MTAGPNDLTTLANVKQWLNVQNTNDDALLQRLITAISTAIQSYLNRTIASTQYTEAYSGSGSDTLAIANYPIQSVQSLVIAKATIAASADGFLPGYIFDDRFLYLIGQSFYQGGLAPGVFPKWPPKGVQITYTAGYATTPADLEQAVIEAIGLRFKERDRIGVQSKSLATETISYVLNALSQTGMAVVNNYRKVVPV